MPELVRDVRVFDLFEVDLAQDLLNIVYGRLQQLFAVAEELQLAPLLELELYLQF